MFLKQGVDLFFIFCSTARLEPVKDVLRSEFGILILSGGQSPSRSHVEMSPGPCSEVGLDRASPNSPLVLTDTLLSE